MSVSVAATSLVTTEATERNRGLFQQENQTSLIAIDPGPTGSAYVVWRDSGLIDFRKVPNEELLEIILASLVEPTHCAIEKIASFGMPVGAEVFETCVWTGRFMQAFGVDRVDRITRIEVKSHLCHSAKANDANIRQALIDRFGGKDLAIGKKANPGCLYGVSGDCWSALAVALTWWDRTAGGRITGTFK